MPSIIDQLRFGKSFLQLIRDPGKTENIFKFLDIGLKYPEDPGALEVVNFDSAEKGEVTSHESHEFYTPPMPLLHTDLVPNDSTTAGSGVIVRRLTHTGTARV